MIFAIVFVFLLTFLGFYGIILKNMYFPTKEKKQMIAFERYKYICSLIEEKGFVSVGELSKALSVSGETIRRDILYLENQNKLIKTHGGAIGIQQRIEPRTLDVRNDECPDLKDELSEYALNLINEDDIIVIDSGSTAIHFCKKIARRFDKLTVVTNHTDVADCFKSCKNFTVIVSGGYFLPEENAFYGDLASEFLEKLHVSKAFLFPSAISLKNGITSCNPKLATVQKTYFKISDKVIIMADSSKFESSGFIKLSDVTPLYTFVTDKSLNKEIYDLYKEKGLNIINS